MCDWRKLPRRVTSRPEIEIADQRSAFSYQTPSIEPSYKTVPKQLKIKISPIAQGFLKIFRVQHVALTVRRPKYPCLAWCTLIFLYENFSRLIPEILTWATIREYDKHSPKIYPVNVIQNRSLWLLQSKVSIFVPLCNFVNFLIFFCVKNSFIDLPRFQQNTKTSTG